MRMPVSGLDLMANRKIGFSVQDRAPLWQDQSVPGSAGGGIEGWAGCKWVGVGLAGCCQFGLASRSAG